MSKDKNKNTPATDSTAPKKEKAKAGSSITAQAKALVLELYTRLTDQLPEITDPPLTLAELIGDSGVAEHFVSLAETLRDTAQRGLSVAVRLANVEKEIAAHWQGLIVNDKAMTANDPAYPAWEAKANSLLTKKNNLLRAQKREAQPESTAATAA